MSDPAMTILSTSNHVQRGMISRMIAVVVAKITTPTIRQATQKAKETDSSGLCWERSFLASISKQRVIGAFGQFSACLEIEILEKNSENIGIVTYSAAIESVLRTELGNDDRLDTYLKQSMDRPDVATLNTGTVNNNDRKNHKKT